ncbi:MAG TPA: fumarylacetoacetate hydrolase family protein [Desulfobacteria bacterium]|nr:fumarylacetoacetate hydrolase family protein [Desulfobacteria bacterium]
MPLSFLRHQPTKVVLVGLNYKDHARELKMPLPDEPILFLKPPTALIGPEDYIIYPKQSKRVDYEAELAVVIKNECKNVEPGEVMDFIEGYTCLNDVTARDLQSKDVQWTRAKSFDTFCPVGPRIVTDIDPDNVKIQSYLNGELRQDSNTSNFIFTTEELVSFTSKVMTLQKGDIIATGTPSGIGAMQRGDTVEIVIEGIGTLRNYVR